MDARRRSRDCSARGETSALDLPRPIFLYVGRVAVEKNLEAFLGLDLPGTKVVVGDGPARGRLSRRIPPDAHFLGAKSGDGAGGDLSPAPTSSSFPRAPTRSAWC